jgi:hypothetical protein
MYIYSNPVTRFFQHRQELLKKIAKIAFHVLTLGIPFLYNKISCKFFVKKGVYSPVCQEAINLSMHILEKCPGTVEQDLRIQPRDSNIAKLATLYEIYGKRLKEKLIEEKNDWNNAEVVTLADNFLKIAYVIGIRTLEETERELSLSEDRRLPPGATTFADALSTPTSYQYLVISFPTLAYHWIRSAANVVKKGKEDMHFDYPKTISDKYAETFYQKGTPQNKWNELYNDYCRRLRLYLTHPKKANNRLLLWTTTDTGVRKFYTLPDNLPFVAIASSYPNF